MEDLSGFPCACAELEDLESMGSISVLDSGETYSEGLDLADSQILSHGIWKRPPRYRIASSEPKKFQKNL